ncbi:MAG TPA: hypothetical protein VGI46_08585, partial [Candidatus Acidoferrum sp.]
MRANPKVSAAAKNILGVALVALAAAFSAAQLAAGAPSPAPAQNASDAPNVQNAKFETRALNGSLADTLRGITAQADKPEWLAYSVPEITGDRTVCCGNFNDGDNY